MLPAMRQQQGLRHLPETPPMQCFEGEQLRMQQIFQCFRRLDGHAHIPGNGNPRLQCLS